MYCINSKYRSVRLAKQQPRFDNSEQSLQIEKLISMNEQAKKRSHGLETTIRNIGIMPAYVTEPLRQIPSKIHQNMAPIYQHIALKVLQSQFQMYPLSAVRLASMRICANLLRRSHIRSADRISTIFWAKLDTFESAHASDEDENCVFERQTCLESLRFVQDYLTNDTEPPISSSHLGQNQLSTFRSSENDKLYLVLASEYEHDPMATRQSAFVG